MIAKLNRIGVAALVLAPVLALSACGGSDDGVTPRPGPDVDVRNGTWSLTFDLSFAGHDSCVARGDTSLAFPDTLLCSFDLVGNESFQFECTSSIDGESVAFDCSATIRELDPCDIIGYIEGSGTVTDTTIDLTASIYAELVGPDEVCSLYQGLVDPCTEVVHITGQWVSDENAEDCPDDDLNKSSVVRALLGRASAMSFATR